VKLASAAFVLLLLAAHGAANPGERLPLPLSVFRDCEDGWWWGYLLFTALQLIALLSMLSLFRAGKEEEATSAALAAVLLFLVAVSPSWDPFHLLCSIALLLFLFRHYWWLLGTARSRWLLPHLLAPLFLLLLSGAHSYGLWQKSLILYFVLLANIRQHLLAREAAGWLAPAATGDLAGGGVKRRRKAYQLEPGRAWSRRKIGTLTSCHS
jgi:hypothetical protein